MPTASELIRALLERELGLLLRGAIDALPYAANRTPARRCSSKAFRLLRTVARRPYSWRLVMSADPDPAVAEHFRNGRAVLVDKVSRRLAPTLDRWGTADKKLPVLVEAVHGRV